MKNALTHMHLHMENAMKEFVAVIFKAELVAILVNKDTSEITNDAINPSKRRLHSRENQ